MFCEIDFNRLVKNLVRYIKENYMDCLDAFYFAMILKLPTMLLGAIHKQRSQKRQTGYISKKSRFLRFSLNNVVKRVRQTVQKSRFSTT